MRWLNLAAFLGLILAANYVTTEHGMIPVGFGLMATAGTYLAGLTFVVRDSLQDTGGRRLVVVAIVAGAVLSFLVSDDRLAMASGVAFLAAETADWLIYTPLRQRGYIRAAVASNIVGAVLDTALFLWLAAPFLSSVDPHFTVEGAFWGQVVGKVTVTLAVVIIVATVRRTRAARA